MAHTPTPWRLVAYRGTWEIWNDNPAIHPDLPQATICQGPGASPGQRDNGEFIVRACNAHEELMTALRGMMIRFEATGEAWMHDPSMVAARAAIAKATGGNNTP